MIFRSRLDLFCNYATIGKWEEGETLWNLLDPMGRSWSRSLYRPGDAEEWRARSLFWQGRLREDDLAIAEHLAIEGKNRAAIRNLHQLCGEWRLGRNEPVQAAASFHEAIRMARERGLSDCASEVGLALAKIHLRQLVDPRAEAERLAKLRSDWRLGTLWLTIGDHEQAKKHALTGYKRAWADGEPYVRRYELTQCAALLQKLGEPIPVLPPYDPARDEKFPWEDKVVEAIEKLKREKNLTGGNGDNGEAGGGTRD